MLLVSMLMTGYPKQGLPAPLRRERGRAVSDVERERVVGVRWRFPQGKGNALLETADVYGPFTNEQLVGRAIPAHAGRHGAK